MLTAPQLLNAAALDPSQFDSDIVNPDFSDSRQKEQLLAYIASDVLPGANAEVSVPFLRKTGSGTIEDFAVKKLSGLDADKRTALIAQGNSLWDLAAKSYGRSELNRTVDTTRREYNQDSDQDRIQGNQRLQKLLDWADAVMASVTDDGEPVTSAPAYSRSSAVRLGW